MIRIFVITPFNPSSEEVHDNLRKMTPNSSGKWLDIEVTDSFDKADYYIVYWCGEAKTRKKCPPNSVINVMNEPSWHIPDQELIGEETIHSRWVTDDYNPAIWWINKTYTELLENSFPEKKRDISFISTGRYKKRVKILLIKLSRRLQEKIPNFFDLFNADFSKHPLPIGWNYRLNFIENFCKKYPGILDLYGRNIGSYDLSKIPEYQGELEDKWNGLAPYRYSFAFENTAEKNYFTEKLVDCILAGCMPIYWGCTNLVNLLQEPFRF